uniref:Uncharacterized protein n=2 Tax=Anguilla anguilla TaxID=7936 RepID=A0A0E9X6L9_ANGAN
MTKTCCSENMFVKYYLILLNVPCCVVFGVAEYMDFEIKTRDSCPLEGTKTNYQITIEGYAMGAYGRRMNLNIVLLKVILGGTKGEKTQSFFLAIFKRRAGFENQSIT